MKKVILRESQTPYTLSVDDETLGNEPIILERNGKPVAALIPIDEFESFQAWRKSEARPQQTDAFEREKPAFERLKPELLRTHRGQVVAIFQGRVVATGSGISETVERVYQQYGYVPCYVQRVDDKPQVYKLPHRRVVS